VRGWGDVRKLVAGAAVLALSACTTPAPIVPQTQLPSTPAAAASPVAVEIDGERLTLGQLDVLAQKELTKAELIHSRKVEDIRRKAAREYIERRLLEAEARRRGLAGPEALLAEAVYSKLPAPTEEDALAFYEQNSEGIEGSFEEVKPRIFEFLLQEAAEDAADDFLSGLWDQAGAKLNVPAVRTKIAVDGPSIGPADAPVTIYEFSDFQCPYCRASGPVMDEIKAHYGDKVRVVFVDFPLEFHERAVPAAIAAHCADAQGRFWPLHDLLFANQDALDDAALRGYGDEIEGLDVAAYEACLKKGDRSKVDAGAAAGDDAGVEGTPAFFVNGILVSGVLPFQEFKAIIDAELAQ
jgi:protein-disulfide isomerase